MANENKITAAFVQKFHDTYDIAAQQKESRLLKTVTNIGKVEGASFTINDMGLVEMTPSGNRFGDTTWTIPDVGVRTALMSDYDLFIPIENRDLPKLKANPTDKYMKLLTSARERKIDDIIYAALIGGITRKTVADNGTESVVTVNLPASQVIAPTFGTLKQQIIKAKSLFRKNECDEQNGEEIFMTYTSDMMADFLNDGDLTDADKMTIQMLRDGAVGTKWLGVEWIAYEKVAAGATEGSKRAVMYTKSAVHFGDADITGFDISTRPDKKNIKQVGGVHSFGAGRANEVKVVAVDFAAA
ncbi:phage capsid protein [Acinetobacter sp. YH1901134]|uniref:phage capsid protein n=1 Tax=Acinetobacter sp. YH1901134 TaxID=2601199 RepID=UPI0015D21DE3|nr:phage capsid protein [Acinetobacter sp. YH1901134]